MTGSLNVSGLARSAWTDFRRAVGSLLLFEAAFKLIEAWLVLPAIALVLSLILSRTGHVALSNRDVLDFLLTPTGLLYASLVGAVAVGLLLVEQAGIMLIVARVESPERRSIRRSLLVAPFRALRVAYLGAIKVAILAVTLVPFVLLAGLTYVLFLSRHDINFYLADRPPRFWLAVGTGVVLGLGAIIVGLILYVRWAFALPILLFEGQAPRRALRSSRERVRGAGWRVGSILLGWQGVALLLGMTLQFGFRALAATVLAGAGDRLAVLVGLLVAQGALLAAVSFVAVVGQALLTRRLYLARSEPPDSLPREAGAEPPRPEPTSPWGRCLIYLSVAAGLAVPVIAWADLPGQLKDRPPVQVTAHRGHARAAPENTRSAVRKAIESGADFAEIDVQMTADGVAVLLHDRDLKRVAGDPRRIDAITTEQVRALDVGQWFDPAFAGERVPTLAEVMELARGRIKLNIELKLYGSDLGVAREVARLVTEARFENECVVTSFSRDALAEVKRFNPQVRTGLIVAHALGDVTRLDYEVLSVRADWLTDEVLREARRGGQEVHVWTVNDERQMRRLMQRGVDNILTSDPDLLIRVRTEWAGLTGAERLVLASRVLLGLDS